MKTPWTSLKMLISFSFDKHIALKTDKFQASKLFSKPETCIESRTQEQLTPGLWKSQNILLVNGQVNCKILLVRQSMLLARTI